MSDAKYSRLKELLDNQNEWPTSYLFKFIVPSNNINKIQDLLPNQSFQKRPSRTGKYISVSFSNEFENSDDIIDVYKKVATIEGVIQL